MAILLMFLSGNLIGSEKPEVPVIELLLARLSRNWLMYHSKEAVETWRNMGIECPYNAPFAPLINNLGSYVNPGYERLDLSSFTEDVQEQATKGLALYSALSDAVRKMDTIPFFLIQQRATDGTLCMLKINEDVQCKLVLGKDQVEEFAEKTDILPRKLKNFQEKPHWTPEAEPWLLEQKILKIMHGSAGFK